MSNFRDFHMPGSNIICPNLDISVFQLLKFKTQKPSQWRVIQLFSCLKQNFHKSKIILSKLVFKLYIKH